jgi:hypothetical protein
MVVGTPSSFSVAAFPAPFRVLFSDTAERALNQAELLLSSPGTVVRVAKNGAVYLYWRVYGPDGKRRDEYLGREDVPATAALLEARRARVAEARDLATAARTLRAQGYAAADNSAAVTLAALCNAGFFRHGGVLVGTHAFGAILNALGARLRANYATEDVDLPRGHRIQLALRPETTFLDLLRASGLPFDEVPELDAGVPASSFKVRGQKLRVDLLVPGDQRYRSIPIPELGVHGTGLPYLDYLVGDSGPAVLLGRDHVVPVRVPAAARFGLHKLLVATLRAGPSAAKAEKDLLQAAVLITVLTDQLGTELEEAARALPASARRRVARSAKRALTLIPPDREAAHDFLAALAQG